MPRLHLVVPCYNPPDGWQTIMAQHFNEFRAAIADWQADVQLVVVDDGSTQPGMDAAFDALRAQIPGVQVQRYAPNRGKGYALRQGVAWGTADWYLVTDADFPYTADSMKRVLQTLLDRGGIAAGNRDAAYYEQVPAFRRWLSKGLRWMLRHGLRQPVADSQCGLKAFDAPGKAVFLETTIERFLFDLEFLMLARNRVRVTPVPVELRPGIVFSKVGWKILFTEGRNFLRLLFAPAPARP